MTGPSENVASAQKWPVKWQVTIGVTALVILLAGFGSWGVMANIAGAIIASGKIEVEQNRQVIQHPDGGVLAEVKVSEGAQVERGQTLVVLEGRQLRSQLNVVEAQLFEILARIGRLTAERDDAAAISLHPVLQEAIAEKPALSSLIDGQERLFQTRVNAKNQALEQLEKRKSQIANQIDGLNAQTAALLSQLDLLAEELAAQQALLDRGLAQAARVLALKREDAGLRGRLGELEALKAESAGRITEADLEILRLRTQREEDAITQLRDLEARAAELLEQRLSLEDRLSRLVITAPVSGLVFGLTVFAERTVIRPADPLLYIVPQDRPLVITGQIDPVHVDEVFLGQDVTLHFSTFDARTTPEVFGKVSTISGDVFTDQVTGFSYYRVEMVLNEGEVARLGEVALVPGMPVDAFIQTGERAPLTYLVKPLTDYFKKAFRET
ncbi:MAG: HlyD family type I secretion periplasmic adaptor subunit [Pseudomonadota bacterium]